MGAPLAIGVCDAFTGQYRDVATFMEALAGAINLEWTRAGVPGCTVTDFRWSTVPGGASQAYVETRPGEKPLTVETLRAEYKRVVQGRG